MIQGNQKPTTNIAAIDKGTITNQKLGIKYRIQIHHPKSSPTNFLRNVSGRHIHESHIMSSRFIRVFQKLNKSGF